jgi:hypothetical protein
MIAASAGFLNGWTRLQGWVEEWPLSHICYPVSRTTYAGSRYLVTTSRALLYVRRQDWQWKLEPGESGLDQCARTRLQT